MPFKHEVFKSSYLKKAHLPRDTVARITGFREEEVRTETGPEMKWVLAFDGELPPLVLNQTNWDTIEQMHGLNSDDWLGKRITLYVDPSIPFGTERKGGIRIRPEAPKAPTSDTPTEEEIPF